MVTWVQLVYHIFLKTKEYSVEFIQCFSFFLVFWLCVCVLFVCNNQCVDKVYLTTPMDLSGIPWLFIYLLFLRGSLIYCTTRPHFLWLRLQHIKAHGDLGAPSLSYLKKNKSELNTQVRYDRMFVHFVLVLRETFSWILCLGKFVYVLYLWFGVYLAVSCLRNYGHD
jgi:hypothetical protein